VSHATPNVTRTELIGRARDLVPAIAARAGRADELRRLPDETHDDLVDAGLYRLYQPRRYGGYECDFALQIDIAAELGRGCGSTAWVHSILASHSWVQGMMTGRCQDEVWGDTPNVVIASANPTRGVRMDEVDGGYLLDGKWSFSSGVDHCDWTHFNILVPRRDAPAEHIFVAAPKSDYAVLDDWYANGLRGTGSKSLVVKELFVPEYRAIRSHACIGGPTPGSAVNPGPLYRLPLFALFGKGIVGPAVGIARGAFETVVDGMRKARTSISTGSKLSDQSTVQVRLAEAAAEIEFAWTRLVADCNEATEIAADGRMPDLSERVRWRRNDAYAANLCVRAAERLYPLLGANLLAEENPVQRHWRDVHAVCAHIALTWDVQGANWGGVLFGNPSTDAKL
jgi:3-hydroxy-9,10-secoandrosta-1,3,5(10)-triene-9,17-dione monooxygenase